MFETLETSGAKKFEHIFISTIAVTQNHKKMNSRYNAKRKIFLKSYDFSIFYKL